MYQAYYSKAALELHQWALEIQHNDRKKAIRLLRIAERKETEVRQHRKRLLKIYPPNHGQLDRPMQVIRPPSNKS